jgi:hypothetical protein
LNEAWFLRGLHLKCKPACSAHAGKMIMKNFQGSPNSNSTLSYARQARDEKQPKAWSAIPAGLQSTLPIKDNWRGAQFQKESRPQEIASFLKLRLFCARDLSSLY